MISSPFEVPSELRDFSEQSIEQARSTFESFLAVARRAASEASGANPAMRSVSARMLAYTEQNVNAVFEFADKLVKAKDPAEAFALQSEHLKAQLAVLESQAHELGAEIRRSIIPGSA